MVLWVILMASNEDIIKELERCGGQYAVANRYRHPSLAPLITSGRGRGVFDVRKVGGHAAVNALLCRDLR